VELDPVLPDWPDELLLGFDPYVELLLEGWLPIEPCALVSVPVWFVELCPVLVVAVPCAVPCVPAVEPVPETEPDCVVPGSLEFEAVRVFLLLLLQPKTNAAASARPYAYFMLCLLKGLGGAFLGAPHEAPGNSPAASQR